MSTLTAAAQALPTAPNFRTNKDQLVRFAGHGEYLVKFLGVCPVSGIRMYDMPGSPYPGHDFDRLEAKEYGMSGPDFLISYYASNDRKQAAQGLELAKKTWFPLPETLGPVKDVLVRAVTWFDKVNGNPYMRATVYANGQRVLELPRQYDNPDNIQNTAADALEKAGFIDRIHRANGTIEAPRDWCKRTGGTFEVKHHPVSYNEYAQRGQYAA